jgi:hypothetical protein
LLLLLLLLVLLFIEKGREGGWYRAYSTMGTQQCLLSYSSPDSFTILSFLHPFFLVFPSPTPSSSLPPYPSRAHPVSPPLSLSPPPPSLHLPLLSPPSLSDPLSHLHPITPSYLYPISLRSLHRSLNGGVRQCLFIPAFHPHSTSLLYSASLILSLSLPILSLSPCANPR